MLGDGRINSLDTHLEQFRLNNQNNQTELQIVIREYSQLLEDYKELRRSYEEQALVSPHSLSEAHNGKPYVLVLIDGNGYIFNDALVKGKEEGGMKAAQLLNEVVEKYLRESHPALKNSRIVVRMYADLTGLSKSLAKSKLIGLEKRSFAAFAAGFTRAVSFFDFVDALDEEGTKYKIREMFKMGSEDPACSHIMFAACQDASYLSQLIPFSGLRDRITLVQGAGFNSEFLQFSLNLAQFPTVFRWSDLPSLTPSKTSNAHLSERIIAPTKPTKVTRELPYRQPPNLNGSWRNNNSASDAMYGAEDVPEQRTNGMQYMNGDSWGHKADATKKPISCKYFQKGFCRFGTKCSFMHGLGLKSSTNEEPKAFDSVDRSNISSLLPTSTVSGFIPLNKDSQRIDPYMRPPNNEEWVVYNTRFRQQKPCNAYHLRRECKTFGCSFDHSDLEPEARHVLEYVLKCSPCPQKSECRALDCFHGHLCQKDDCVGQQKGCRMKADLHNVDPKLASMVPVSGSEGLIDVETPIETDTTWY